SYLVENSQYEVYSTDDPAKGQLAVTRYKTLQSNGKFSLMEVELDTGRKNQIRVHFKDLGHPISGDRKYGAEASPLHRLALHARTLKFVHPTTGKLMDFSTDIPAGFSRITR
ncbi:MAG: pseudouridine synthase, partial [Bacteroides sp.]|nr:pseudouridine synthase [Bacteroides sp.]